MLTTVLARVWRGLPLPVQMAGVALREALYTVTVMGVITDDEDRVLLLEHRFRRSTWGLPGGFVARGEQPDDSLRRELLEETGLALGSIDVAHVRALRNARIEIVFWGRATGEPSPDGFEVSTARWVPIGELPQFLDRDDLELFTKILEKSRDKR